MDKNETGQVVTSFGDRCNNCCIFCFNRNRGRLRDETRSLEVVKRDIVLGAQNGATILSLEGGEPTINKEIFEIIKFARRKGFSKIEIITNGRMLSYEKFAKEIIKVGVTKIIFSIHGHNPELHDLLTRVPGSFEQLTRGIINIKKLNFSNIGSHTVIIKYNYRYLPRIGRLLTSFNIRDATFSFVIPMGDAKNNFFKIVPYISETTPFLYKTLDIGKKHGFFWKVRYYPLCCLGDYKKFSQRVIYEKIPKREKAPQCFKCEYFDECDGIWEEYIKNMGYNELKPIQKNY
jgi:MoaA/NifB/PqqE/SkfB family radical SAM enzyme